MQPSLLKMQFLEVPSSGRETTSVKHTVKAEDTEVGKPFEEDAPVYLNK